jgi:ABC-2 type transport system ATP-binding protein
VTGPVIALEGVGKRYWKLEEASGIRAVLPFARSGRAPLWALRDVDLTIGRGETVGILGRNGSGKTTLLRMLCGVTQPSEGRLRVEGHVAPLIGVGVGFHPEITGRDNVYVNGLLLGMTEDQISERFDAIVEFAELADFIETPVKYYSSGMFVRLGFAVAVHSDPEVLLVDEVLAVGDLSYQLKCVERMQELRSSGCTIVFVSHAIASIRYLCPRALVVHQGRLVFDGPSEDAVGRYHELLSSGGEEASLSGERGRRSGSLEIGERSLIGPEGPGSSFARDVPLEFRLTVRSSASRCSARTAGLPTESTPRSATTTAATRPERRRP